MITITRPSSNARVFLVSDEIVRGTPYTHGAERHVTSNINRNLYLLRNLLTLKETTRAPEKEGNVVVDFYFEGDGHIDLKDPKVAELLNYNLRVARGHLGALHTEYLSRFPNEFLPIRNLLFPRFKFESPTSRVTMEQVFKATFPTALPASALGSAASMLPWGLTHLTYDATSIVFSTLKPKYGGPTLDEANARLRLALHTINRHPSRPFKGMF